MRPSQTFFFLFYLLPIWTFSQVTYTVNTTNDNDDGNCNSIHCSLREAINAANTDEVASNIRFNITGSTPFRIRVSSALPSIVDNHTTIDGTTQPNWDLGDIIIDGSNLSSGSGLKITASHNKVLGLKIEFFKGPGIFLDDGENNTIGEEGKGNILVNNENHGILVNDNYSHINYNYIGVDGLTYTIKANDWSGIRAKDATQFNISHNIIGGNKNKGILITDASNFNVANNQIGGQLPNSTFGNGQSGIHIIRGDDFDITDNFVANNGVYGVNIMDSQNFDVIGNNVGYENDSGTIDMGNANMGIRCFESNDFNLLENNCNSNLSSGIVAKKCSNANITNNSTINNDSHGIIVIDHEANLMIERNIVGTNQLGQANFGNGINGIEVRLNSYTGAFKNIFINENLLAYNTGNGIEIDNEIALLRRNSIFCNANEEIENVFDNSSNAKSPPNIQSVSDLIRGTSEAYNNIELFKLTQNTNCTDCGGEEYIGSTTANASGEWSINLPLGLEFGDKISATASSNIATSEFSECVEIDFIPCENCLIVNTNDDTDDGTCNEAHCSLREAINVANQNNDRTIINFLNTYDSISINTILPTITADNTVIEAKGITIAGSNLSAGNGLQIKATNCEISGLRILNFPENGISLDGTRDCIIRNNIIGGNTLDGIYLKNDTASIISGNSIGLSFAGFADYTFTIRECETSSHADTTEQEIIDYADYQNFGNGSRGIYIDESTQNIIDSNLVGYNLKHGILITDSDLFRVANNNVGTDGIQSLSNEKHGIHISRSENYLLAKNNTGHNKWSGIRLFENTGGLIDSNLIHSNQNHGITVLDDSGSLRISNNFIGTDNRRIKLRNGRNGIVIIRQDALVGDKNIDINNNVIAYNGYNGIRIIDEIVNISDNETYCNTNLGIKSTGSQTKDIPIILTVNETISGTAEAFDFVEIYYSNIEDCGRISCQGEVLIGSTTANASGNWSLPAPTNMQAEKVITATATKIGDGTSQFALCYTVLPDICQYAQNIPLNKKACSEVGIILDMALLTDGSDTPLSDCQNTYAGKDAWFKVVVPKTGNLLIRTNTINEVIPVIEAYTGNCDTLSLAPNAACSVLEEVPYAMLFENYSNEATIYLRVWDKNNTMLDSGEATILNISAFELPANKLDWLLCDENNTLINPTKISEREANRFLIEYNGTASSEEIEADKRALKAEGAMPMDSFKCDNIHLELWATSDPIVLEEKRLAAKAKASVDTTNYNYLFEAREFQVNSYAIGRQSGVTVSMDESGNFAMVWRDLERKHNYGRLYNSSGNPVTPEFLVGAVDQTQYSSSIAMKEDGSFIVVWYQINPAFAEGIANIVGRQYDAAGVPLAAPFEISLAAADALPINTAEEQAFKSTVQIGTNPEIGVDSDGNFIVVWHAGFHIFAQRFDKDNNLKGSLIKIGANTENLCIPNPSIDVNDNGDFVVAWAAYGEYGDTDIFAQRYNSNGMLLGDSSILVNYHTPRNQSKPDVALANDGSFIVTWESTYIGDDNSFIILEEDSDFTGENFNIYARRFDENGQALTPDFLVNTNTNNQQELPSISLFNDGRYAIAWTSNGQDGNEEGVFAKLFDNNNIPISTGVVDTIVSNGIGDEFRVNNFTNLAQKRPQLINDGSSILLAAWEDGGNEINDIEGETSTGIFGQRYELIGLGSNTTFYPIGTATPSKLLGDTLLYPSVAYLPSENSASVKVATIDTGIDRFHPFLVNALWENPEANDSDNCQEGDIYGYNFVSESAEIEDLDGHGTGVNGIIAREFDSNVKLELMNLKFHELNRGNVFDAVSSIYYAVNNGAEVLNLSWGFEAAEFPSMLYNALKYAADHDVLIVTSAGNTSKNNDAINKYPSNFDLENMIVVTAYEIKNADGSIRLANYASFGETVVDIAAPGFYEIPLFGTDTKTLAAGTSLAAPLVARTAAIIKGQYPTLTALEIKDCILSSAEFVSSLSGKTATGGILNHDAALACAEDKTNQALAEDSTEENIELNEDKTQTNQGETTKGLLKHNNDFASTKNNTGPEVAIRVFLQAPLRGKSMTNSLSLLDILPMTEPYSALGGYGMLDNAKVSVKQSILTDKAIVDWVIVELRDTPSNVISRRAMLLGKNGYVIDPVSGKHPFFPEAVIGNSYYIVIKHRNHLGVMSAMRVQLD